MNRRIGYVAVVGVCLFSGVALADELERNVHTEQRNTQVDTNTGEVNQQHRERNESEQQIQTGPANSASTDGTIQTGTAPLYRGDARGQLSQPNAATDTGSNTAVERSDRASSAVRTDSDGKVSVEHQKEHEESRSVQ